MVVHTTAGTATTTASASTSYIESTPSSLGNDAPAQRRCNTCHAAFNSSILQREHMKSQWHVYNLKRRVAELSPLDWEVFEEQILPTLETSRRSEENNEDASDIENVEEDEDSEDEDADINSCLFCNYRTVLATDRQDTEPSFTLLSHMQKHHSFFIPHLSSLTSLPTFLSYLATLVHTYHECLHCGAVRGSREAVQMHMRARGHCRLDFAKESELWAFWEEDVPCSLPGKAPTGELELLSAGTGRTRARDAAKKARMARMERALLQSRPEQDIPSVGPPEVPSASPHQASGPLLRAQDARNAPDPTSLAPRQLSRRTEQGMLGIPLQQRRTLMAVAKQAQQSAQVRANAEAWGRERCANKQKYYRAAGPMRPNG